MAAKLEFLDISVTINDKEILESIEPEKADQLLLRLGYTFSRDISRLGSDMPARLYEGQEMEMLTPDGPRMLPVQRTVLGTRKYADYALRMSDLIREINEDHGIPQLRLLYELSPKFQKMVDDT